jgi:hypothetical protein
MIDLKNPPAAPHAIVRPASEPGRIIITYFDAEGTLVDAIGMDVMQFTGQSTWVKSIASHALGWKATS